MNKSFLKWAGGKSQLVEKIKSLMPAKNSGRYIEPFVGSGVVALNVDFSHIIINDINSHLIGVWEALKENGKQFIEESGFSLTDNTESMYYKLRKKFNFYPTPDLFLYLNRHCFNGLCRYNSKGEFNVPYGHYKKVYFPEKELKDAAVKVQKMTIYDLPFEDIFKKVIAGDVVYCDPPYIPRNMTSNFTAYTKEGFTYSDHVRLADLALHVSYDIGATVIISNTNCPEAYTLYRNLGAEISYVDVRKSISCKANGRVKQGEIIAVFKPRVKI